MTGAATEFSGIAASASSQRSVGRSVETREPKSSSSTGWPMRPAAGKGQQAGSGSRQPANCGAARAGTGRTPRRSNLGPAAFNSISLDSIPLYLSAVRRPPSAVRLCVRVRCLLFVEREVSGRRRELCRRSLRLAAHWPSQMTLIDTDNLWRQSNPFILWPSDRSAGAETNARSLRFVGLAI